MISDLLFRTAMRLDIFLVEKFSLNSRTKAQELIKKNLVFVFVKKSNGEVFKKILTKSGYHLSEEEMENIRIDAHDFDKFVSRAGLKLEGALQFLKLKFDQLRVLDIGQSTGGFSDCAMFYGAKQVVGIDVGQQQIHSRLRDRPEIKIFEGLHVKDLKQHHDFNQEVQKELFDVLVCDVSFISVTKVIPFVKPYIKPRGHFLVLIKPQFECGADALDKNGIIKDESILAELEINMLTYFNTHFSCSSVFFKSILKGKDGNQEYFIYGQNESDSNSGSDSQ